MNDGSQYYNCTVNGFLPYNTVDDLCAAQANSPDPCPLGVGHHTVRAAARAQLRRTRSAARAGTGPREVPRGTRPTACPTIPMQDTGVIEVPSGVTKMKCTIQWTTGAGDEVRGEDGGGGGVVLRTGVSMLPCACSSLTRKHHPQQSASLPRRSAKQILCATAQWDVSAAAAAADAEAIPAPAVVHA